MGIQLAGHRGLAYGINSHKPTELARVVPRSPRNQ